MTLTEFIEQAREDGRVVQWADLDRGDVVLVIDVRDGRISWTGALAVRVEPGENSIALQCIRPSPMRYPATGSGWGYAQRTLEFIKLDSVPPFDPE